MDATIYTTVLDLRENNPKEIFKLMRENHKRDIRKYIDRVDCEFISSKKTKKYCFRGKIFLKIFIFLVAKNTHPDLVFSIFSKMIINNNAVLVKVIHNMEVAAYVLIVTYKNHAYYLMGGQKDAKVPLIKTALFKSIDYLIDIGISSFEVGRMEFELSIFQKTDYKKRQISFFKKVLAEP